MSMYLQNNNYISILFNQASDYSTLRYINASTSGMSTEDFSSNYYLIHLNLAFNNLTYIGHISLPNLQELDMSKNVITIVSASTFLQFPNLKFLNLSWNPITVFMQSKIMQSSLKQLLLRGLDFPILYFDNFSTFSNLMEIDLSFGTLREIGDFSQLAHLQVINMKGSPIESFPPEIYTGLANLRVVEAPNFKMCCNQLLPEHFLPSNCKSPLDEISSCQNLLRADGYRIFLWTAAFLSICGVYRLHNLSEIN